MKIFLSLILALGVTCLTFAAPVNSVNKGSTTANSSIDNATSAIPVTSGNTIRKPKVVSATNKNHHRHEHKHSHKYHKTRYNKHVTKQQPTTAYTTNLNNLIPPIAASNVAANNITKTTASNTKITTSSIKPTTLNALNANKQHTTIDDYARDNTNNVVAPTSIDINLISHQPRLYSYSALVMDADTGRVLISKNPDRKLPIASITKLMTAMVLLDSNADLDDYVMINSADIDTLRNTSSRLRVGSKIKRRDLLLLALMSSENRAAYALGRTAYPGGISVFIQKMNEKAKSIGMLNTIFYDPTGLTEANQSTAKDLSKMVQAAFDYSLIRQYTTTKGADVALTPRYIHHYINSDALVRVDKFPIALSKTGFINEAGHCLVLYTSILNRPMVMVFLNSAAKNGRLADAIAVRSYIARNFNSIQPAVAYKE
jgi:serine-type D-Ala-D-Ala endopeptidase (penicillin-binding protein 7)